MSWPEASVLLDGAVYVGRVRAYNPDDLSLLIEERRAPFTVRHIIREHVIRVNVEMAVKYRLTDEYEVYAEGHRAPDKWLEWREQICANENDDG